MYKITMALYAVLCMPIDVITAAACYNSFVNSYVSKYIFPSKF